MTPQEILAGILKKSFSGGSFLTPEEESILNSSPGCGGCFFLSVIFLFLALYVGSSLLAKLFGLFSVYTGGF